MVARAPLLTRLPLPAHLPVALSIARALASAVSDLWRLLSSPHRNALKEAALALSLT